MEKIKINDIMIDVVRKDIKNLHLAVYPPEGRVRIATPLKINDEAVRLFAISRLGWIKRQIRKYETQERQSVRELVSGETHYFLGQRFLLNVIDTNEKPHIVIRNKTHLDLYVKPESNYKQRAKVLQDFYRTEIKKEAAPFIQKWTQILGVELEDWRIKLMKTKWGSCNSSEKRIWLNLELAKKSSNCIEYIVVHELLHLIERTHNKRYTQLLDAYLPKWRQYKSELNELVFD